MTEAYLERVERLDPSLRSYITVLGDSAREAARASERRHRCHAALGPLDGVPLGLKDLYDTAGVRTTAASRVFERRVPAADATVVRRLVARGAVVLGKHTMNEFASGRPREGDPFPPPANPWSLAMQSGGSSSGSAVAVAAGLCAGAFGSDTGGSIRLPASNCGIVGLKPTNGVVSTYGVVPLSWTLDAAGPLARTVEDAALLLAAVAGHDERDPLSADVEPPDPRGALARSLRGVRVGAPVEFVERYPGMDAESLAAYHTALRLLGDLGAAVRSIALPPEADRAKDVFAPIMHVEALAYHREMLHRNADLYGERFRARLLDARAVQATDYALALRARADLVSAFDRFMRDHDVLALPTVPWPHARIDDSAPVPPDRALLTFIFNLTGQPAISVPCGFTSAKLPLGLQLAGRRFGEAELLGAAAAFERATGSAAWHPPVDALVDAVTRVETT